MIKTKIIIHGVAGRMGKEILSLLQDHDSAEYFSGVDYGGRGTVQNISEITQLKRSVVIDFSGAAGFSQALSWCVKNRVPLVSGSTGLSKAQKNAMNKAAQKIPILWSANMSPGVSLFTKILNAIGKNLKPFDLQLVEAHHSQKKDAPSGTAIYLQNVVESVSGKKMPSIQSIRGGGIVGEHKLHIMAKEEMLTIEHIALNRAVFARGAIDAAVWIERKKRGLYNMGDILE